MIKNNLFLFLKVRHFNHSLTPNATCLFNVGVEGDFTYQTLVIELDKYTPVEEQSTIAYDNLDLSCARILAYLQTQ